MERWFGGGEPVVANANDLLYVAEFMLIWNGVPFLMATNGVVYAIYWALITVVVVVATLVVHFLFWHLVIRTVVRVLLWTGKKVLSAVRRGHGDDHKPPHNHTHQEEEEDPATG